VTPRVKNEKRRSATVPSDDFVDEVLTLDEELVSQLQFTGSAVAEIDGEVVRLEIA